MKRSIVGAALRRRARSRDSRRRGAADRRVAGAEPVLADRDSRAATTTSPPSRSRQGSTLYPDSEIEPRSARFGSTIVGEYQQDRWSDGGARGLVTSVSHDNGASWHRVVVPGDHASARAASYRSRLGSVGVVRAERRPVRDLAELLRQSEPEPQRDHRVEVDRPRRHWGPPIEVTADNTNGLDKESITADPFNSSYVYAAWDRLVTPGGKHPCLRPGRSSTRSSYKSQTFFTRSTDGGATWETPQQIFVDSSFSGSIGGMIRVLGSERTLLDGLADLRQRSVEGRQVRQRLGAPLARSRRRRGRRSR